MKGITKDQFYLDQIEALKKRITQEREGVEEFKQMMNDAFKDLEAERDALVAQVEALSKLHSDLTNADMVFEDDVHSGYLITTEQIDEMEHLLATPAACLAQVRADAGRAGFVAGTECCSDYLDTYYADIDFTRHADQYAESIRQGNPK
jgi:predicted nuclease with TOPRIM domain